VPELPDIEAYRIAVSREVTGEELRWHRIYHPFLLRSVDVPPDAANGLRVSDVFRVGKRIVLEFPGELFVVFHLMIAGRFRWTAGNSPDPGGRPGARTGILAQFGFTSGVLSLTEAGSKRRASLHIVRGRDQVLSMKRGGMELLDEGASADSFADRLRSENHTLKRALTDPRLFSGIGNAYSDEILFEAGMSPFLMTGSISNADAEHLFLATVSVLTTWRDRLVAEAESRFPAKVTAFRPEMHVHGKYGKPCDVCGTPVQRIRYAENESNYCPGCQTGGKIYADRALSRLLKGDWPRTVEELEKLPGQQ